MAKLSRKAGVTSQIWQIFIADSSSATGAGLTGLTHSSSGLTAYYNRDTSSSDTAISLTSMTAGTFTSGGFVEIDSTNMKGVYQFCPPNLALATGASSSLVYLQGAANMAPLPIEVDLDSQVDVYLWQGTAVATPATAGRPSVDVVSINDVSASSVTEIDAYIGTTVKPLFDSNSCIKSDLVDIAGSAVSTSSAQLGVNVVQIDNETASAAGTVTFPGTIASATNITAGTITTVTNLTNAPTSGDFTSTMKTSIGTAVAASAVASVTATVSANVTAINSVSTTNVTTVNAVLGQANTLHVTSGGIAYADLQTIKTQSVTCAGSVTVLASVGTANALTVDSTGGANVFKYYDPTATAYENFPAYFYELGITSAGKLTEVATVDTLTTYTGNTPQTGDSYAIVHSGTYGNNALLTAIEAVATTTLTEAYPTLGSPGSLSTLLQLVNQRTSYLSISGESYTTYKQDGSTTAAVNTLNSSTAPTASARTT